MLLPVMLVTVSLLPSRVRVKTPQKASSPSWSHWNWTDPANISFYSSEILNVFPNLSAILWRKAREGL